MPKNPPPEHTRWKPGQSGNPLGRPALPPHLQKIKEFTTEEIKRVLAKYMRMNPKKIQEAMKDPETTMLDMTICSILINAAKTGDYSRVDFMLNRTVGKVKETMEVIQPEPVVIKRADGSEIELGVKKEG